MSLICTHEPIDIFLDMAYLSVETLCVSMFRGDEDFFLILSVQKMHLTLVENN